MGKTVGIYFDEKVLKYIDEQASKLGMNRSEYINLVFTKTVEYSPKIDEMIDDIFKVIESYKKPEIEIELETQK